MISDIETILTAFAGNWKPGIEEQSIRMAHAVALQGDTATASNILRFIAIPEPMKLQILGASLQPAPPTTAANPIDDRVSAETLLTAKPARQMPEPLLQEVDTANPIAPSLHAITESDLQKPSESEPVAPPAFSSNLVEPTIPEPANPIAVEPVVTTPVLPSTPVGSLPFQREQLFNAAFATVQSTSAGQTSKPMVKDADNIPVIHTYAEPEPSSREASISKSEASSKGLKLFQSLDIFLGKVITSSDVAQRSSAVAQWDRLNSEFPDYKDLHSADWGSMQAIVLKLKDPSTLPVEPVAPIMEKNESVAPDITSVAAEAVAPVMSVQQPESVTSGGGYFARKAAVAAAPKSTITEEVVVTPSVAPTEAAPSIEMLDTITLPNEFIVAKSMTITGDSIYRVDTIQKSDKSVVVYFTDEINKFAVPADALSAALDNPDTQPDTFFAGYSITT